jgi:sugar-specific transcriptional regulator TrmB
MSNVMAKKFVLGELSEKHEFVQQIKETLEKATKQKVAVIIVDKMVRKSSVATKKLNFNFEEGQSISLVLRTDGDVIQQFLNNKNILIQSDGLRQAQ